MNINLLYKFKSVPDSPLYYGNRTPILIVFTIFAILSALITSLLFAKHALISIEPKMKWKGRFLALAFISFTVGALLDSFLPRDSLLLVIVRVILIFSAFEYYLGFFLPEPFANLLIE